MNREYAYVTQEDLKQMPLWKEKKVAPAGHQSEVVLAIQMAQDS